MSSGLRRRAYLHRLARVVGVCRRHRETMARVFGGVPREWRDE